MGKASRKHNLATGLAVASFLLQVCLWSGLDAVAGLAETTLESKFREANAAYSQGHFDAALEKYGELIGIVGPSASLYYNHGCAALKALHLGEAVVDFERAARLAPRDEDIQANLKFVKALIKTEGEETGIGGSLILGALERWLFILSGREVSLLQIIFVLWFAAGATVIAGGYAGRLRKFVLGVSIAGLVFLLLNSALLGAQLYRRAYLHDAVVTVTNAEAYSGPGDENTRVLVLPEGTLVRLRQKRNGWDLISLPSGRSGWLKGSALEEI